MPSGETSRRALRPSGSEARPFSPPAKAQADFLPLRQTRTPPKAALFARTTVIFPPPRVLRLVRA